MLAVSWAFPGLSSEPARPDGDGYTSLCVAGTAGRELWCNVSLTHHSIRAGGSGQGGEKPASKCLAFLCWEFGSVSPKFMLGNTRSKVPLAVF